MALVVIVFLLLNSVFTNERFQWSIVREYLVDETIIRGVLVTLQITFACMALGVSLGAVIAVMRLSSNPVLRVIALTYVSFFRGTPVLVQLLAWYNIAALYPMITFGLPGVALDANEFITPIAAAILGLGLNEAAYMSEIVRAGILSVDDGQSTAAKALGLTKAQTIRRIVLPQAMTVIIPPTGNELIGMLKTTSLVSVLAVGDLLFSAQTIYAANFQTIPLLIIVSFWYLVITAVFSAGQHWLERRYSRARRAIGISAGHAPHRANNISRRLGKGMDA